MYRKTHVTVDSGMMIHVFGLNTVASAVSEWLRAMGLVISIVWIKKNASPNCCGLLLWNADAPTKLHQALPFNLGSEARHKRTWRTSRVTTLGN